MAALKQQSTSHLTANNLVHCNNSYTVSRGLCIADRLYKTSQTMINSPPPLNLLNIDPHILVIWGDLKWTLGEIADVFVPPPSKRALLPPAGWYLGAHAFQS